MSQNCVNCGSPVGDSPFCSNCGAPVKAAKTKKALKLPSKKILLPAAAVVAVILVLAIVLAIPSGGSTYSGVLYPLYSNDDEATCFADGTKLLEDTIDGDYYYSRSSMDQAVTVYLAEDDTLWAVTKKGLVELGDEVETFQLSADGSTVAYIDVDQSLYLGSTKTGECEEIAEDAVSVVLSPNGKTVVYMTYEKDEPVTWLHNAKEPVELGESLYPLAVSDGAKYLYCINEKNALVLVDKKGDTEKLCADVDDGNDFLFNKDLSQIIFCAKDKWYICVKGGEKEKISIDATYLSMLTPRWSQSVTTGYAAIYNVKSLTGRFYYGSGEIVYLQKNLESEKVVDEVDTVTVSDDGKRVYFLTDNNRLKYVTASDPDEEVDVAKHVYDYEVLSDGKTVCYYDEDNILYVLKGKKTVEIEEEVFSIYRTHDDKVLFLAERDQSGNGTLYLIKGDKAEEISEDVHTVALRPNVTYYWEQTDDMEYDIYAAKGTNFELLLEEAGG